MENLKDKSIEIFTDITDKYDTYIKMKAIKQVDEKLLLHSLKVEDIASDDYEAMIDSEMSKIKEEYASNTAKVGLSLLGLDLLFW